MIYKYFQFQATKHPQQRREWAFYHPIPHAFNHDISWSMHSVFLLFSQLNLWCQLMITFLMPWLLPRIIAILSWQVIIAKLTSHKRLLFFGGEYLPLHLLCQIVPNPVLLIWRKLISQSQFGFWQLCIHCNKFWYIICLSSNIKILYICDDFFHDLKIISFSHFILRSWI